LEKGLKDHTDKFHQSAEHLIHTWEVVAGERTGQYMRNGPTQSWADFDGNVDSPGDAIHWERSVAPYVKDMSGRVYWRYLPKLSYSKAAHLPKMFAIWYPRYKPGQWRQHRDALEKVREALEDNDSNARMFVYSKVVGGQVGCMLFALVWIVGLKCGQTRLTFGTNWKKHLVKVRGMRFLMLAALQLKITILRCYYSDPNSLRQYQSKLKKINNKKPRICGVFCFYKSKARSPFPLTDLVTWPFS